MKKLFILLLTISFSQAGIDDVIKKNPFGLDFTPKNIDHIKLGAGIVIGGLGATYLLNSRHVYKNIGTKYEDSLTDLNNELKRNPTLTEKYNDKKQDLKYKRNKDYFVFGLTRTFVVAAPLGYLFYWWKSNN